MDFWIVIEGIVMHVFYMPNRHVQTDGKYYRKQKP